MPSHFNHVKTNTASIIEFKIEKKEQRKNKLQIERIEIHKRLKQIEIK